MERRDFFPLQTNVFFILYTVYRHVVSIFCQPFIVSAQKDAFREFSNVGVLDAISSEF